MPERGGVDRAVRQSAARGARTTLGAEGEVVVADNGSDRRKPRAGAGAPARGSSTSAAGATAARTSPGSPPPAGDYIVMADADLTYDFADIPRFVEQLDDGAELVMGNRMQNIKPGAMPWHHRYIGNPVLTGVLNLFFRTGVRDAHCGMRAVRRDASRGSTCARPGMEFASEMVIRAAKENLEIREIPIEYHPRRASPSSRASGTAGGTCASCSSTARHASSSSRAR